MFTRFPIFVLLATVNFPVGSCNGQEAKLLFADDFERNESQEVTEELGGRWSTNSEKRARGNKQCNLNAGALFMTRHETADHGVSLVHPAKYGDCRVHLRFRIDDKRDDFGIDFADTKSKEVHAGHICKVVFRPSGIEIFDFKNGRMKKTYRDAVKANEATEEQKSAVAKWQRKFDVPVALGKWHDVIVTIRSGEMAVELDEKPVGAFKSPGMAHPEMNLIRFSARRKAGIDDVKMYALGSK